MKQDKLVSCLGLLAGLVGFSIVGAILNGWALSVLWGWFVVPLFNLPQLTIIQAIGLAMVVGFLTKDYSPAKYKDMTLEERIGNLISITVFLPIMSIAMGWLVLQFV